VLGWTPLGLAWSAPADIVDGAFAGGLLRLTLALVFLVLALMAWDALLRSALENPRATSGARASTGAASRDSGLGWFSWLPATPTGAVAARSITSWRRDPRYMSSGALMLLLPLGLLVSPLTGGSRAWSLAMAPAAGFLLGWSTHNDIAYDGTAFWSHVATGLSGRADRIGRLAPTALAGLVLLPVYAALACIPHRQMEPVARHVRHRARIPSQRLRRRQRHERPQALPGAGPGREPLRRPLRALRP